MLSGSQEMWPERPAAFYSVEHASNSSLEHRDSDYWPVLTATLFRRQRTRFSFSPSIATYP
jgi:hypothetical protein